METVIIIFTTIAACFIIAKLLTVKKTDILDILLLVVLNILIIRSDKKIIDIICLCLLGLAMLYTIFSFVTNYLIYDLRTKQLFKEYITKFISQCNRGQ